MKRCTCRHGTHGEGTGHAPLCPAFSPSAKKVSSSFTIVDVKDKDVQAFLDRKSSTFPAWMTRSSLASAIRTMDTFASPDVEFAVVQLRSSGKKDRFGQVLVDRVFILDRKGAVVTSWNPQT